MNAAHRDFFQKHPLGPALSAIVRDPGALRAYEEFIHCGLPPVQAVVRQAEPLLEQISEDERTYAIQSLGALVGNVLENDYVVVRDSRGVSRRGRLKNARLIRSGTIFSPRPVRDAAFADAMDIARKGMKRYRNALAELAK